MMMLRLYIFRQAGLALTVSLFCGMRFCDAADLGASRMLQHEFHTSHFDRNLAYLAYIPPHVDITKPAPLLMYLPDRAEPVKKIMQQWTDGKDLGIHSMILITPALISAPHQEEILLAHFQEILRDVERHYRIDHDRVYLWGAGHGDTQARYIARHVPGLFAAILSEEPAPPRSLDFYTFLNLPSDMQHSMIRRDPFSYEQNYKHLLLDSTDLAVNGQLSWKGACSRLLGYRRSKPDAQPIGFRINRIRFKPYAHLSVASFQSSFEIGSVSVCPSVSDPSEWLLTLHNIDRMSLHALPGLSSLRINGEKVSIKPETVNRLHIDQGKWRASPHPLAMILSEKYAERAGPLKDALYTPFVFVYGTDGLFRLALKEWAQRTASHARFTCHDFEGRAYRFPVVSDKQALANADLLGCKTLICLGGRKENLIVRALPDIAMPGSAILKGQRAGFSHACVQPSPYSVGAYVVIHEASSYSVPLAAARLDWEVDWVVYNSNDGSIKAEGFFDRTWRAEQPLD